MIARTSLAAVLVLALGIAVAGDVSLADAPGAPGQVYAFGYDIDGELGNAAAPLTNTHTALLADLPAASGRATALAAGYSHSLVATSSGLVYAFGANDRGQLGNATGNRTANAYPAPQQVTLPGASGGVTAVAAGEFFSLVATASGQLYAFGINFAGELGSTANNGDPEAPNPTPTPVSLPGATGPVVQVSAGQEHSLALTSTGQAYAFGANLFGQLGNGTNLATENPNPVPHLIVLPAGAGTIVQVAAGGAHTLVLTATGKVYAFGINVYGQLGNPTNNGIFASNPAPALLALPDATGPVVQIAAGGDHSLVLTSTGQLFAFGNNFYGQLGDTADNGTDTPDPTPVLVSLPSGAAPILRIAAGSDSSLAITTTGQVYAWGHNNDGQLGSATPATSQPAPTPVDLPAGTAIDALAEGPEANHTLAIVSGLAVVNGSLTAGQVAVPYAASAAASGGTAPYSWAASGLPPGLALDPTSGQISGTPTTAGSSTVVLTVRDAHGITVTSPALPLAIAAVATTTTATTGATVTTEQLKGSLLTQIAPKGKPAKIAALLKAKRYTLSFKALRAGSLVIDWYYLPKGATLTSKKPRATLVAAGKKTFSAAGKATVTVKFTARGLQMLRTAKHLKITARDVFTPRGARAVTSSKTFTLSR